MKCVDCVVYLNWPEKCFRANADDIRYLKTLLPRSAKVTLVRSDRAFVRALSTATLAITWNFKREWYALAPNLRLVATPAAGHEFVAMPPEGMKNPPAVHYGQFHGAIISESVAAFVLAWARGFFARRYLDGDWPRTEISTMCREVAGSQAIVLGFGHIGRAIGAKLESLGVSVEGYSRHRPLPSGKLDCDWFIVALPATTGTDNLIDSSLLKRLPRRAVLINVGRGNAVDEKALVKALRAKRIAGAYLDVLKTEPSATVLNHPGAVKAFLSNQVPNAVVMPHCSAFTPNYFRHCFNELFSNGGYVTL